MRKITPALLSLGTAFVGVGEALSQSTQIERPAGSVMVQPVSYSADQSIKHLPAIQIPEEIDFVNRQTGREVTIPAGTMIELPEQGDNIQTLSRRWTSGGKTVSGRSTFIMPDKNGVFAVPQGTIFNIPGQGRQTFSGLAFKTKQGTDFIHVVPGIAFRPGQHGMMFEIDADRLHVAGGRAAPTPSFVSQYDWIGDLRNLPPQIADRVRASHDDRRPDASNVTYMVRHVATQHNLDSSQTMMGLFQAMQVHAERRRAPANRFEP